MDFRKAFEFDPSSSLSDYDPSFTGPFSRKKDVKQSFKSGLKSLNELQGKLYAQGSHGVLIILQAMDAGGKDGVIKHVMSGVNPQGCHVKSFMAPSENELSHDFMWRCIRALPARGQIGIFNRSYYEEVLIVKVHEKLLYNQNLPFLSDGKPPGNEFWQTRYNDISNFEKYFTNNGFLVIKFFLNVSREEQKKRFLSRIDRPEKNWKFTLADVRERQHWDKYRKAYEQMILNTSKDYAPWHIIPADKKWFMRTAVCNIIVDKLRELNLHYPVVGPEHIEIIKKGKAMLEKEA